jgi:hypothetical protein
LVNGFLSIITSARDIQDEKQQVFGEAPFPLFASFDLQQRRKGGRKS